MENVTLYLRSKQKLFEYLENTFNLKNESIDILKSIYNYLKSQNDHTLEAVYTPEAKRFYINSYLIEFINILNESNYIYNINIINLIYLEFFTIFQNESEV